MEEICGLLDLSRKGPIFSHWDGRFLAVAERNELTLWDVHAGQHVRRFARQGSEIKAVAFAPDGKVIVTASENGTLLVWDVTGRLKDGRLPRIVLNATELEAQWRDLANADAAGAHRALWTLAAGGPQAASHVAKRLQPIPRLAPKQLTQWIRDLDSDDFKGRHVFGLGKAAKAGKLTVTWPNREKQSYDGLATDRYWRIAEGQKEALDLSRE
jgi:hypothetical protein